MSHRSRSAAADRRFLDALQRVVSCVTPAVLVQDRSARGPHGSVAFPGRATRLQGRQTLDFSFLHVFDRVEPGDRPGIAVRTVGYAYQLYDQDGPELIAWHWHPAQPGLAEFPHLHVTARSGGARIERKHHVPTGFVSAPAVIRFAITELGVRPRRPDWEQILVEAEGIVGRWGPE